MLQPWERGQGIPGGASESAIQYERFSFYRDLGEGRTVAAAAKRFGVSWQAIHRAARLYRWQERVSAFDQHRAAPGPVSAALALLEVAPAPSELEVNPTTLPRDLTSQEEFRAAVEKLGRTQLAASQSLTAVSVGLAEHLNCLVQRIPATGATGESTAPVEACRSLREAIGSTSRALQAVSSAAAQMSSSGRENWGQAVGIEMLLAKFEALIALAPGV